MSTRFIASRHSSQFTPWLSAISKLRSLQHPTAHQFDRHCTAPDRQTRPDRLCMVVTPADTVQQFSGSAQLQIPAVTCSETPLLSPSTTSYMALRHGRWLW